MKTELQAMQRALVLEGPGTPLKLIERPVPEASAGSAVIRVLATPIAQYMPNVLNGTRPGYPLAYPIIPGSCAIGRVVSAGRDAVRLEEGQFVYVDIYLRARGLSFTT